jgi:hypothetical protein
MSSNVIPFPFQRAAARPSANSSSLRAAHPCVARPNCAEGLSSGMTPDAAPGGSRSIPPSVASTSPAQPLFFPGEVEVRMVDIEVIYMLVAGLLTVALMTVVLL